MEKLSKMAIIKVHKSYRKVVAVCDSDLLGKRIEENVNGNIAQLDLTGPFFKGEEVSDRELKELLIDYNKEDATFNIVGKESVRIAREAGVVKKDGIIVIGGVPFGLVLM